MKPGLIDLIRRSILKNLHIWIIRNLSHTLIAFSFSRNVKMSATEDIDINRKTLFFSNLTAINILFTVETVYL